MTKKSINDYQCDGLYDQKHSEIFQRLIEIANIVFPYIHDQQLIYYFSNIIWLILNAGEAYLIIFIMQVEINQVKNNLIFPGGVILNQNQKYNALNILQNHDQKLVSLKLGYIQKSQKSFEKDKINYLDVLSFPIIYQPQKNDLVICTIKMKSADYYTVDMLAPLDGVLGSLEFDGATKRNKPIINQGALVYCRVIQYSKYTGAKLSCLNKGFNTNNELGQLNRGMKILAPRFKHKQVQKRLQLISKYIKFEIAFGKNGLIWIGQSTSEGIIALYNVISQILCGASQQMIMKILSTVK